MNIAKSNANSAKSIIFVTILFLVKFTLIVPGNFWQLLKFAFKYAKVFIWKMLAVLLFYHYSLLSPIVENNYVKHNCSYLNMNYCKLHLPWLTQEVSIITICSPNKPFPEGRMAEHTCFVTSFYQKT